MAMGEERTTMELRDREYTGNSDLQLPADAPPRVVIAFDQLTDSEKVAVLAALQALGRNGSQALSPAAGALRLDGLEPLYVLRPAPDVRMIVRAVEGTPIEVMDIVRPAALRNFAHAT
jgi:hypothetical protein